MKKIIFLFAFLLCHLSNIHAQGYFRDRMPPMPNINPLKVGGIVTMSVGAAVMGVGLLTYSLGSSSRGSNGSSSSSGNHDESNVIVGVGAGMVVVGGVLLIVGSTQGHKKRWSLVTPKKNEIGLSYSF